MKFKWTKIQQEALKEIKRIVVHIVLSAYTDSNKEYKIHTNARKFQVGVVISQECKQITLYSRKLTEPQTKYTVIEREMLSIVDNLKEYQTMLLFQRLKRYSDNENSTCNF